MLRRAVALPVVEVPYLRRPAGWQLAYYPDTIGYIKLFDGGQIACVLPVRRSGGDKAWIAFVGGKQLRASNDAYFFKSIHGIRAAEGAWSPRDVGRHQRGGP